MDKAPSHIDKSILNEFEKKNAIYSLISGEMIYIFTTLRYRS